MSVDTVGHWLVKCDTRCPLNGRTLAIEVPSEVSGYCRTLANEVARAVSGYYRTLAPARTATQDVSGYCRTLAVEVSHKMSVDTVGYWLMKCDTRCQWILSDAGC